MTRRSLLRTSGLAPLGAAASAASAAVSNIQITRIRYYHVSDSRPVFNQSSHVVTVETGAGIIGIG